MPKVLRIINRLNLGGPTYNAAYLSRYLAPEFETMLVAGIKEDSEESSEFIVKNMGLNPVYIPEMHREISLKNDMASYRKIKKLIADFQPDIVHTHAAKAGTLGRLAASAMKVPVILHTFHGHVFHSYFNPVKTALFKTIEKQLAKKSSRIIAISEIQKTELCDIHNICSRSKTVVIPLGFDLSRFQTNQEQLRSSFRELHGLADSTIAIGIIGRIVHVKNHSLFILSFNDVKKRSPHKITGFIIGDGEDRVQMENLCRSENLTFSTPENPIPGADIIFTSWIIDIERPLAAMDIIAMTSLNEGTPVSLIEAQAAGKPIVSTEVGGIGNVVLRDETALLSPSGDIKGFADNLLKLVTDSTLRHSMEYRGRPFVSSRFHYERLVKDTRELYNSLLGRK
jgi:glycosyltransferase involved in cell wall biosynthesis